MIHSIIINDFRALKDINIVLGKYITAISGRNGLGKSTILALIGNSCELKSNDGKTLFNTQFRTEFSEIFKGSKEFDVKGPDRCRINFCSNSNPNVITQKKICRTTWQDKGTRFRVIPETKEETESNSRKIEWPSLYLGLSRLYPIGEASDKDKRFKVNNIKVLDEEDNEFFISNYVNILNLKVENQDEICVDIIDIGETKRKKGIGVNTANYSSITNSAGQDNIGQIIMSILSFKKLRQSYDKYEGGLLLIDELEATLHPIAQLKLLDFLYKQCKELNLQVVFTTHSISLLENLSLKILRNSNDSINDYEVYYCSKANGPLTFYRNPEFSTMKGDLTLAMPGSNVDRITLYSEDAEGRWFLNKLIKGYETYVKCINTKLPCSILLQLNSNDLIYFSNVMIILDGDVSDKDLEKNNKFGNIVRLPGRVRPEEVIYNFLLNLDPDSELWQYGLRVSFTKETIIEYGPLSNKYKGIERERFKKWFNDNLQIFEELSVIEYWIKCNSEEVDKFINSFKKSYNSIARRNFYTLI